MCEIGHANTRKVVHTQLQRKTSHTFYLIIMGGDDMDVNIVQQLISSLGFPIVCVIALFWMWNKEREEHKAESEKWCEAINNNTLVMQQLIGKLDNK